MRFFMAIPGYPSTRLRNFSSLEGHQQRIGRGRRLGINKIIKDVFTYGF